MVLGTPDATSLKLDEKKVTFLEDVSSDSSLAKLKNEPVGLVNLGNTCYLNSSLQALLGVGELRKELENYQPSGSSSGNFILFLKQLFEKLSAKEDKVVPLNFLTSLRLQFPQFSERSEHGQYKQQDAEEAFSLILNDVLRQFGSLENFLKIGLAVSTKCLETEEEPVTSFEESLKLDCHINIKTNFLKDGLVNNLKETIQKNNDSLGRDAQYEISRKIVRLPKYLTVHFMRFFWRRDTNKKSKILRKVQFPFQLDLTDLLDDSVRESKSVIRDKIYKIEKDNEEEARDFKKAKKSQSDITLSAREKEQKQKEDLEKLQSKWTKSYESAFPEDFDPASGENPSSLYELQSIITHQGSSADSGHYQCFVKDELDPTGERWYKFNDAIVTVVSRDKVEQLAGGGESDSALICLYKAVGLK
ncbi:unnamed protein product [Kuraishia capsulata CBS 1993]|uniref:Ubiquitin carboxyl-terminal hydrolase n=1 Tax=Kuraishia capsulata CBS 1993 TaxID=1382522 RepID=W6MK29_9ASCO|nr:uncharacterized protein KUCA_T00002645001 [Kuraishia capsulata CBS 1993]CDK26671.1 unnamed protein product [Kuraishia capsulata CBS 1993]